MTTSQPEVMAMAQLQDASAYRASHDPIDTALNWGTLVSPPLLIDDSAKFDGLKVYKAPLSLTVRGTTGQRVVKADVLGVLDCATGNRYVIEDPVKAYQRQVAAGRGRPEEPMTLVEKFTWRGIVMGYGGDGALYKPTLDIATRVLMARWGLVEELTKNVAKQATIAAEAQRESPVLAG